MKSGAVKIYFIAMVKTAEVGLSEWRSLSRNFRNCRNAATAA
jgi:hypothetical protein